MIPQSTQAKELDDMAEDNKMVDLNDHASRGTNSGHVQALHIMDRDREECANPHLCLGVEHGHRQFSNTLQLIIRDKDDALILASSTAGWQDCRKQLKVMRTVKAEMEIVRTVCVDFVLDSFTGIRNCATSRSNAHEGCRDLCQRSWPDSGDMLYGESD